MLLLSRRRDLTSCAVGTVYFCLVRNDEGREYSVDEQQQGSFLSQEYIVCFLSEPPDSAADNSTFELYPLNQRCCCVCVS